MGNSGKEGTFVESVTTRVKAVNSIGNGPRRWAKVRAPAQYACMGNEAVHTERVHRIATRGRGDRVVEAKDRVFVASSLRAANIDENLGGYTCAPAQCASTCATSVTATFNAAIVRSLR